MPRRGRSCAGGGDGTLLAARDAAHARGFGVTRVEQLDLGNRPVLLLRQLRGLPAPWDFLLTINSSYLVLFTAILCLYVARVYKNIVARPLSVVDWRQSALAGKEGLESEAPETGASWGARKRLNRLNAALRASRGPGAILSPEGSGVSVTADRA